MSKVNYSKIEDAFHEGLFRMKINEIVDSSSKNAKNKYERHPAQSFQAIVQELKWLKKTDPDIHKHIKISKKEISDLAECIKKRRDSLKDSEVKRIAELQEIIKKYREDNFPEVDNELYIEDENDKHQYKRHNVSEKWIPLDVPKK
jgi:hypothetical protein